MTITGDLPVALALFGVYLVIHVGNVILMGLESWVEEQSRDD